MFLLFYILVISYSLYYLVAKYLKNSGLQAQQAKYLIIAMLFGFVGGGMTFLYTFNILIPPYGVILFAFYPIVVAYAITKHCLFNVKIIATELFVFTTSILLAVRILLSVNPLNVQEIILNLIIFISVVFVGFLVVKNTSKEVEAKKKLLEQTKQSLDFEKRLKQTFAEIAEEQTKKIEQIVSNRK